MTCREIVEFLDAYVAGELQTARAALFDLHLAGCEPCRHYLATFRQTVRIAKAAIKDEDDSAKPGIPEDLVKAILSARAGVK